jgi:hypothetical protein
MPSAAVPDDNPLADDWVTVMRAGDFERAWQISDRDLAAIRHSGLEKHEGPRHLQRIWRGEALEGRRILVRCYHGLGDTIQFARFLPPLRRLAGEVIVWCQGELLPLIAEVQGVDRALPLHDGTPDVEFDVDIEIMEIPHAIRASREEVTMCRPYLTAPRCGGLMETTDGKALSVGLVWDVGSWDRRRVVPCRLLQPLNRAGVQLYSLQRGPAAYGAAELRATDISTPEISELAARLQQIDLCVCPDTMVAHLAAALGRETWIMLHTDCDWRWPASGHQTFWYPTVRLFRQRVPGDWRDVVMDISAAIFEKAQRSRAGSDGPYRKMERSGVPTDGENCGR